MACITTEKMCGTEARKYRQYKSGAPLMFGLQTVNTVQSLPKSNTEYKNSDMHTPIQNKKICQIFQNQENSRHINSLKQVLLQ